MSTRDIEIVVQLYLKNQFFHYFHFSPFFTQLHKNSLKIFFDAILKLFRFFSHFSNFLVIFKFSFTQNRQMQFFNFSTFLISSNFLFLVSSTRRSLSTNFRHTRDVAGASRVLKTIRTEWQMAFEWADFHTRCMILFWFYLSAFASVVLFRFEFSQVRICWIREKLLAAVALTQSFVHMLWSWNIWLAWRDYHRYENIECRVCDCTKLCAMCQWWFDLRRWFSTLLQTLIPTHCQLE